jgi:hypothetical protein
MATSLGPSDRIVRDEDFDYPWINWLNGHLWELTLGQDFHEPVATFRQRAYRTLRRFSLGQDRLRTKFNKKTGVLLLQAFTLDKVTRTWIPISYDPAPAEPQAGLDHPAPSEPPAQPGAWIPAPPRLPQ